MLSTTVVIWYGKSLVLGVTTFVLLTQTTNTDKKTSKNNKQNIGTNNWYSRNLEHFGPGVDGRRPAAGHIHRIHCLVVVLVVVVCCHVCKAMDQMAT
jgi:hypothetical protein